MAIFGAESFAFVSLHAEPFDLFQDVDVVIVGMGKAERPFALHGGLGPEGNDIRAAPRIG